MSLVDDLQCFLNIFVREEDCAIVVLLLSPLNMCTPLFYKLSTFKILINSTFNISSNKNLVSELQKIK